MVISSDLTDGGSGGNFMFQRGYHLVIRISEGTCFEIVISPFDYSFCRYSHWDIGSVMLHHSCWSQTVELTLDLTSQTQIFDTDKLESILLIEWVVRIWGSYQN